MALSPAVWRGKAGCRPLPLAAFPVDARACALKLGPGRGFAGWSATARAGAAGCLARGWLRRFACHGPRLARVCRRGYRPEGRAYDRRSCRAASLQRQRRVPVLISGVASRCRHVRCWARCLFISNMVTLSLPNTFLSLSSARISRRFSGFCRLCDRM